MPLLSRHRLLYALLLLLLLGCGGGSGGGVGVPGTGQAPDPRPVTQTATIRLENVLARAVPASVDELRLTGFAADGSVLYGPRIQSKQAVMEYSQVPVTVRILQVEYLQQQRPVGLARFEITLTPGQVLILRDLDFEDITSALNSLTVEPSSLQLADGTKGNLRAVARYKDGAVLDLTRSVRWAVSSASATVSQDGQVTAQSPGVAQVTARFGDMNAEAGVTVTSATAVSLRFEPSAFSLAVGTRVPFLVRATFSDGSQQDVTNVASLGVDGEEIARLEPSAGTLLGVASGQTTLSASFQGCSASATVLVSSATLTRIDLSLNPASLPLGVSLGLQAVGVFDDGSTQDLTDDVVWASARPEIVQVARDGMAEALQVGDTTVTASFGAVSGSARLTVDPAVVDTLELNTTEVQLPRGLQHQIRVTAIYTDKSRADVTDQAAYLSSSPAVAEVTTLLPRGNVTAREIGETTITVRFGGQEATLLVQTTDAVLLSLSVSPIQTDLPLGASQSLVARATYSDGSEPDVTDRVLWSSREAEVAEVDARGKVLARALGQALIDAKLGELTGSATIDVGPAVQSGLSLYPPSNSTLVIPLGRSEQLYVDALFTNGDALTITDDASYVSFPAGVVSVTTTGANRGLIKGLVKGEATVRVTYGEFSEDIQVEVVDPVLMGLRISPTLAMSAPGSFRVYQAFSLFSDGTEIESTSSVVWGSSSDKVTFDSAEPGVARLALDAPVGVGQDVVVTASLPDFSASGTLSVGNYLFAANDTDPNVGTPRTFLTSFSYANNGSLAKVGEVSVDRFPINLAIHPTGRFLYVPGTSTNRITSFRINTDGTLTSLGSVSAQTGPYQLTVDPSGRYVFSTNSSNGTLGAYRVLSNGALEANNPATGALLIGGRVRSLDVSRDGRFLFVSSRDGDQVVSLAIGIDGRLSVVDTVGGTPTVNGGGEVRAHPTLDLLYTIGPDTERLYWWNIDSSGRLSLLGSLFLEGYYFRQIDLSPDLRNVYMTGLTQVLSAGLAADGTAGPLIDRDRLGLVADKGILERSGRFYYGSSFNAAWHGIVILRRESDGTLTQVDVYSLARSPSAYAAIP